MYKWWKHIINNRVWQLHALYNESAMEGCRVHHALIIGKWLHNMLAKQTGIMDLIWLIDWSIDQSIQQSIDLNQEQMINPLQYFQSFLKLEHKEQFAVPKMYAMKAKKETTMR